MGRKRAEVRNYFNIKNKSAECKFCKVVYKVLNATKMQKHIGKCFKCPSDIRNSFLKANEKKPAEETLALVAVAEPEPCQSTSSGTGSISTQSVVMKSYVDTMNLTEQVSNLYKIIISLTKRHKVIHIIILNQCTQKDDHTSPFFFNILFI